MTTEEYEQTIRPALAKFCGYDYSENVSLWHDPQGVSCYPSDLPDPLRNPAAAWALETALVDTGRTVWFDKTLAGYGCDIDAELEIQWAPTREEALVLAAWEVVRRTAERPSGE